MKDYTFLALVILVNCGFVFLLVHKNSTLVGLTYKKQSYEKEYAVLSRKKENLEHELAQVQSQSDIKRFAQNKLGMYKIRRKDVKELPVLTEIIATCSI